MTNLVQQLYALSDQGYAEFQYKIVHTVAREKIIGVRVPELRQFAKKIADTPAAVAFLQQLPHTYYDEDMLHAILLSLCSDSEVCVQQIQAFLPYINNWAVCDTLRPKVFRHNKQSFLPTVKQWIASEPPFTCRFGLEMLMIWYLEQDFEPEFLEYPLAITLDDYYVQMMIAWYYATALALQWDWTVPYLEKRCLPQWVHQKTVQKACESFRISSAQKLYLRGLRYE